MIDPGICIVCDKPLAKPSWHDGVALGSSSTRAGIHDRCVLRTPGVLCAGYTALDLRCDAPWYVRLWRLVSNPIRYVVTGEVRWWSLADKLRCDECDACGAAIELHLGYHAAQVAPSPDPDAITEYVVRLCRKCKAGMQHAAAKFVAYTRRSRGAAPLWEETT